MNYGYVKHYDDVQLTLKEYIEQKIEILKDLGIHLNSRDTEYIKSLKSEIQVDNFAHDLIRKREYLV